MTRELADVNAEGRTIDAACCTDRKGFASAFVLLSSIIASQPSRLNMAFHVIHNGIEETKTRALDKIAQASAQKVRVEYHEIEPERYFRGAGVHGLMTYARILIPKLIPASRVLYLDTDLVIRSSLEQLSDVPLDFPIGVTPEGTAGHSNCKHFLRENGGRPDDPYFNTGVILIDCERWRRDGIADSLLELARKHDFQFPTHDQTLFNFFFKDRVTRLDPRYNFLLHARAYGSTYETWRDQAILHFIGRPKPWEALGRLSSNYPVWRNVKRDLGIAQPPVFLGDIPVNIKKNLRYLPSHARALNRRLQAATRRAA